MVGVGCREGEAWWLPAGGIRASQGTFSSFCLFVFLYIFQSWRNIVYFCVSFYSFQLNKINYDVFAHDRKMYTYKGAAYSPYRDNWLP